MLLLAGTITYHQGVVLAATDQVPADNGTGSWSYLLTLLVPFIVALVNRPDWSSNAKRGVMLAVSVLFTLVVMYFDGAFTDFELTSLMTYVVAVVGGAQVWYTALKAVPVGAKALDVTENAVRGEVVVGQHEDPA